MNRRGFLRSLIGGVATATAVRTWPFRIFSFPTDIATPLPPTLVQEAVDTWHVSNLAALYRILKQVYAPAIREQLERTHYNLRMYDISVGEESANEVT